MSNSEWHKEQSIGEAAIRRMAEEDRRRGARVAALEAVATAAQDLSDAAEALNRAAESPAESRSSAPEVRYVRSLASLRAALAALGERAA